jgi:hypothetical protein
MASAAEGYRLSFLLFVNSFSRNMPLAWLLQPYRPMPGNLRAAGRLTEKR